MPQHSSKNRTNKLKTLLNKLVKTDAAVPETEIKIEDNVIRSPDTDEPIDCYDPCDPTTWYCDPYAETPIEPGDQLEKVKKLEVALVIENQGGSGGSSGDCPPGDPRPRLCGECPEGPDGGGHPCLVGYDCETHQNDPALVCEKSRENFCNGGGLHLPDCECVSPSNNDMSHPNPCPPGESGFNCLQYYNGETGEFEMPPSGKTASEICQIFRDADGCTFDFFAQQGCTLNPCSMSCGLFGWSHGNPEQHCNSNAEDVEDLCQRIDEYKDRCLNEDGTPKSGWLSRSDCAACGTSPGSALDAIDKAQKCQSCFGVPIPDCVQDLIDNPFELPEPPNRGPSEPCDCDSSLGTPRDANKNCCSFDDVPNKCYVSTTLTDMFGREALNDLVEDFLEEKVQEGGCTRVGPHDECECEGFFAWNAWCKEWKARARSAIRNTVNRINVSCNGSPPSLEDIRNKLMNECTCFIQTNNGDHQSQKSCRFTFRCSGDPGSGEPLEPGWFGPSAPPQDCGPGMGGYGSVNATKQRSNNNVFDTLSNLRSKLKGNLRKNDGH